MNQPLEQRPAFFVDSELSFRFESAEWLPSLGMVDALQRDHPEVGAAKQQVAGGWMCYAGPQSPLNHMVGMGLQGPVSVEEFDQVEAFYRDRGSICEIVVSPYVDPSMMALLSQRGYQVSEWNSVLVRELLGNESFTTDDLDIRPVSQSDALKWAKVIASCFAEIPGVTPELFLPFAAATNAICFIAYIDGKAVGGAGGSVFPKEGVSPFYGAATLPEYRNRGVQNALFQVRLQAATKAGCKYALVSTQPGTVSQRNAERNGFHVAYTKVAMQRAF